MARKRKKNKSDLQQNSSSHKTLGKSTSTWPTEATQSVFQGFETIDKYLFGGLLLFILSIYVYTLWPTVAGGDAGELTTAAYTWGIVHPPGYPLFVIAGKLFSYLPFGTVGWRINLVSAVFSVSASAFFFLALYRVTKNSAAAFLATGVLSFTPLIWRYSILAEVFTINNFFVCLLIYLFVKFQQERQHKTVYLMGFVFGLGLCNHHTLIFVGIPMGLWILFQDKKYFLQPANFLKLFLISIAGLTPYVYLHIASLQTPLIAWGDITTWDGFLKHFFRKEYGTFKLATEGTDKNQLFHGLWFYIKSTSVQTMYLGWALILPAIHYLRTSKDNLDKSLFWLFLLIPCGYLLFFHSLANLPFVDGASLYKDIVSRFWIMPDLFVFFFLGLGAAWWIKKYSLTHKTVVPIAVAIILIQMGYHFNKENARNNYSFAEFGRNLLKPLPEGAVFFTLGDINTNAVRYVQQCESYRTDVRVLDRSLMSYPWLKRIQQKHYPEIVLPGIAYNPTHPLGYNFKKLFDANYSKHKIYMTFIKQKGAMESGDKSHQDEYRLVPYGLSFKVERKSKPFDIDQYITDSKSYLVNPDTAFPDPPPPASWEEVIYNNYWLGHHLRAVEILRYGMGHGFDKKYLSLAGNLIEDLVQRRQGSPADYYKNIGIANHHMERTSEGPERLAYRKKMLENWEIYLNQSQALDSPTYQKIRTIVEAYNKASTINKMPASEHR